MQILTPKPHPKRTSSKGSMTETRPWHESGGCSHSSQGGTSCASAIGAFMHLTDGVGSCARCWANLQTSLKTDFDEGVHDASTQHMIKVSFPGSRRHAGTRAYPQTPPQTRERERERDIAFPRHNGLSSAGKAAHAQAEREGTKGWRMSAMPRSGPSGRCCHTTADDNVCPRCIQSKQVRAPCSERGCAQYGTSAEE
jgi:hypothetical protein